MTQSQKEQIQRLRNTGFGYKKIAQAVGMSANTVASYCRRNAIKRKIDADCCQQCGVMIEQTPKHRRKKFCSDQCRMTWWRAHPNEINRKAVYSCVCRFCGTVFESYGNSKRKYCSRICYGRSKAKGDSENGTARKNYTL